MEKMLFVALLVSCTTMLVQAADTSFNTDKAYVTVMESSGALMASKQMNISNDKNKISVTLTKLEQTLENGTSSTVENITGLMVTVTEPANQTIGDTTARRVVATTSSTINGGTAKLTVDIYYGGTNISIGDEKTVVAEGDIGVTFQMDAYTFAEDTNLLMATFTVMGSKNPPTEITENKGTDGKAFDLGGNGVLRLSQMVKSAAAPEMNATVNDPPKFTVTFKKGTNLEYQFFVKLADADNNTGGGGGTGAATRLTSLGLFTLLICFLLSHMS